MPSRRAGCTAIAWMSSSTPKSKSASWSPSRSSDDSALTSGNSTGSTSSALLAEVRTGAKVGVIPTSRSSDPTMNAMNIRSTRTASTPSNPAPRSVARARSTGSRPASEWSCRVTTSRVERG
jgi:hypothetical protein